MEDNLARARVRKAAMNWADCEAPAPAEGDTIMGTRVEAFEAGAAWAAEEAIRATSAAAVNEIVASLIRDAQAAGGDDIADMAAKRIEAYFAGVHGAEQDLWAIERAHGQRQLDEAGALIREAAELLRGYEAHHRDRAQGYRLSLDPSADNPDAWGANAARMQQERSSEEKAKRNGDMAARLEAWLAGAPLPGSMEAADQAAQEAFVSAQLDAGIDQIGEADESPPPASPAETDDLAAAIAGASLIEEGPGWVKVHGLRDAVPLFGILTAAWNKSGAMPYRLSGARQAAALQAAIGHPVSKRGGDYDFDGEVRAFVIKRSGAIRYVVEDARGLLLIMNAAQCGLDVGQLSPAPWRGAGVADLAAFRINTPDPRFDPGAAVAINGFLFHPAKEK